MKRLLVFALLLVGGTAGAVVLLRVDEIKVVGIDSLSARGIVEASGLEPGDRILWERLSVAERRIEKIPAVASVVAERSLPSTVVLRVIEREPIARLDGARELVVDDDGVVFDAAERDVRAVLYGWKGDARPGARVDAASRVVLEAFPRFPPVLVEWARRLRVSDTFTLTLLGDTQIRFGVLRDLEDKAKVAEAVLSAERGRGTRLAYVDVRSPTVPVSRERSEATPTPTAPAGAGASPAPEPAPDPVAEASPAPSPVR